jgi:thiosulfate dehydrogenase (quinone) large subunit
MQITGTPQSPENDAAFAYLLLRATLGVNILIHGASRILIGPAKFVAVLAQQFHATPLPAPMVAAFAYMLPWAEAVVGAFVLLGLFSRLALRAGAALILVLTVGSTLAQDWIAAGWQLVYALVYAALLAFLRANQYSLDAWLRRRGS